MTAFSHIPTCYTISKSRGTAFEYPKNSDHFHPLYHHHSSLNSMMSRLDYCSSYSLVSLSPPLLLQATLGTKARGTLLKNMSESVTSSARSLGWVIYTSHGLEEPAWCGPQPICYMHHHDHNSVICSMLVSLTIFFFVP